MADFLPAVYPPKLVGVADAFPHSTLLFPDPDLPGVVSRYGEDFTFGRGAAIPSGWGVGSDEADLKAKMWKLLSIFAPAERGGAAERLFALFLANRGKIHYFADRELSDAVAKHPNIRSFCHAVLSAPGDPKQRHGRRGIHEALKDANWDLTKINPVRDLGAPALNIGRKYRFEDDWINGLFLMIDGFQHVYVLVNRYLHDAKKGVYHIELQYRFYDVFGLDREDINTYGAWSGHSWSNSTVGIMAWWQLQHQFGYAPLVTRVCLKEQFTVPAE